MNESDQKTLRRAGRIRLVVILVLLASALVETSILVKDFQVTRQQGGLQRGRSFEQQTPVESWMTFNYVNILFNLPADYLRAGLNITDPRYPNIEIRRYAKVHDINQGALVQEIIQEIAKYGGI